MRALEELRKINPDVAACAVLAPDGQVEAYEADVDQEDVLGPILTTFAGMAERATQELGRGGLVQVVLEGTQGLMVARDLGAGRLLAVLASPHARLGLLLDDVRAAASAVGAAPEVSRV